MRADRCARGGTQEPARWLRPAGAFGAAAAAVAALTAGPALAADVAAPVQQLAQAIAGPSIPGARWCDDPASGTRDEITRKSTHFACCQRSVHGVRTQERVTWNGIARCFLSRSPVSCEINGSKHTDSMGIIDSDITGSRCDFFSRLGTLLYPVPAIVCLSYSDISFRV